MKPNYFKYLGYLQIFIGMGALAGGLPMVFNPDGSTQGLTTEVLQNSPFDNYLIPGLLLFIIHGLGSLIASYFSLKIKSIAGTLAIIFGVAMMIWIMVQMYYLGFSSWLQALYLALGTVELFLGIKIYKMVR